MNQKIIETGPEFPEVLLYIDELEDAKNALWDCVIIQAIGKDAEESDKLIFERINFPDRNMCRSFIADYSKESAEAFCRERNIEYANPNPKDREND